MKKCFILYLIFYSLTVNCPTADGQLTPVKDHTQRIHGNGLSILPPQGKNWHILDNPNGGLNFAKILDGPSHTFICSLTVVPSDENFTNTDKFLEAVKKMQENFTQIDRFKNIKSNYSLNERFGVFSVEYQISVTDVEQKKKYGRPSILKMRGYSFVHPKQPNYLVDIVYSERGTAEEFTPSLQKVGKEFIDSLIIEDEPLLLENEVRE